MRDIAGENSFSQKLTEMKGRQAKSPCFSREKTCQVLFCTKKSSLQNKKSIERILEKSQYIGLTY